MRFLGATTTDKRHENHFIETHFNEAPLGIFFVDSDSRICEVNRAARPAFAEIPDLIGKDIGDVLRTLRPRAYAEEIVRLFSHTLETGEPYFAPGCIEERLDRQSTVHYEWWNEAYHPGG